MNNKKWIVLLALLAAFPPLSTDMYLPAIPILQQQWNEPLSVVNLTLSAYFVSYCILLLIYGPLSDRYGRKPPVIIGTIVYILGCLFCSLSPNIICLVIARVMQAGGDAAAVVISIAITKDIFTGKKRERILAYIGMITALAPMLAPIIGSLILTLFSWRWIFVIQGLIGLLACILVIGMQETSIERITGNPLKAMKNYVPVIKNKHFIFLCLSFSSIAFPLFTFVAGSPNIFIQYFHVPEQYFGFYFAVNAIALMTGSFTFTRISKYLKSKTIMTCAFNGILIGGIIMISIPIVTPIEMSFSMAIVSFSIGILTAPINNFLLEQIGPKETGTASAIIIANFFIFGSIAMSLISFNWTNKIMIIGKVCIAVGGFLSVFWFFASRIKRN